MDYNIDDHIKAVKECDFLSENRDTFYDKLKTKSVLCSGAYSSHVPLVSILITTYKRVDTLKIALESAINQKDFDDYEIVIVDNEAADIKTETETSRYVKSVQSDKILYYRNLSPALHRMDTGVALLRTEWVAFLHDDDFLSPWALKMLTDTLKGEPDARWIVGSMKGFHNEDMDNVLKCQMRCPSIISYARYPRKFYQESHKPTWLGSLIHVETYIRHGGIPAIGLGNGDSAMSIRFACLEDVLWINTDIPLYNYRVWKSSCTGSGAKALQKNFVSTYLFRSYILDKFNVKHRWFWKLRTWMKIVYDVTAYKTAYNYTEEDYYAEIDINEMAQKLNIPKCWRNNKRLYNWVPEIYNMTEKRYDKYVETVSK